MKPYQFYVVDKMPSLAQGESVKNPIQLTFTGADEEIDTIITLESESFEGGLDQYRIQSEIKYNTMGYIKTLVGSNRQRFDFTEYLKPVDFYAFYSRERKALLFQAPKRECRGVYCHLKKSTNIVLKEMQVDFGKVMQLQQEYLGAWFRGVSARVHAAGISGEQIQDDPLYKDLSKIGELSNVTLPWNFNGNIHKVMVTASGAIILIQTYSNIGLELALAMDVYDRLLTNVWVEKGFSGLEETD